MKSITFITVNLNPFQEHIFNWYVGKKLSAILIETDIELDGNLIPKKPSSHLTPLVHPWQSKPFKQ